jgi:hypothetical protein
MAGRLEILDGQSWEPFVRSPLALLMLGKSDCAACNAWTEELEQFLAQDAAYAHVRFGKIFLDKPGLVSFKRAHPWIAELDNLPCNVLFVNGEKRKQWLGGGVERMTHRIDTLE